MQLGERILVELDARASTDTLTRWLAHDLAELLETAEQARVAGAPDATARAADARRAILELWQQRSTWPGGWPPPHAAEIVRLLDALPEIGDGRWYGGTVLTQLHNVHFRVLGALADLATSGDHSIEDGWLAAYGEQLTVDELTILARAAAIDDRLGALNDLWQAGGGDSAESHPVARLADTYRQIVLDCMQSAWSDPEVADGGNTNDRDRDGG